MRWIADSLFVIPPLNLLGLNKRLLKAVDIQEADIIMVVDVAVFAAAQKLVLLGDVVTEVIKLFASDLTVRRKDTRIFCWC